MTKPITTALRDLRRSRGLTQDQAGQLLGVTGATFGQWETGKRSPSWETVLNIVEAFDVDATVSPDGTVTFSPAGTYQPDPIDPDDPALGEDVTD